MQKKKEEKKKKKIIDYCGQRKGKTKIESCFMTNNYSNYNVLFNFGQQNHCYSGYLLLVVLLYLKVDF